MSPGKEKCIRKVQSKTKLLPGYMNARKLPDPAQETLEHYSKIPAEDIAPHVERVVSLRSHKTAPFHSSSFP